jgi:glutamyl-tRNAGlu reductase-like protein
MQVLPQSPSERSTSSRTRSVSRAGLSDQPGVFSLTHIDDAPNRMNARQATVATITALERHHEEFRESEVERARRLLAGGTPEEQVLGELARRLTNKFLHAPTQALRDADTTERARLVAFLSHVYHLPVAVMTGAKRADELSPDVLAR